MREGKALLVLGTMIPAGTACEFREVEDGGGSLETWEAARSVAQRIRDEVVGRDMPPSGSLPPTEIEWVRRWVDAGAPEHEP